MLESKTIAFSSYVLLLAFGAWILQQWQGWDPELLFKMVIPAALGTVGIRGAAEHIGKGLQRNASLDLDLDEDGG